MVSASLATKTRPNTWNPPSCLWIWLFQILFAGVASREVIWESMGTGLELTEQMGFYSIWGPHRTMAASVCSNQFNTNNKWRKRNFKVFCKATTNLIKVCNNRLTFTRKEGVHTINETSSTGSIMGVSRATTRFFRVPPVSWTGQDPQMSTSRRSSRARMCAHRTCPQVWMEQAFTAKNTPIVDRLTQRGKASMDEEIQLMRSIIQSRCELADIIKLLEIKQTTKRSTIGSSLCAYPVSKTVTVLGLARSVQTLTRTQWPIRCTTSNGPNTRQQTSLSRWTQEAVSPMIDAPVPTKTTCDVVCTKLAKLEQVTARFTALTVNRLARMKTIPNWTKMSSLIYKIWHK